MGNLRKPKPEAERYHLVPHCDIDGVVQRTNQGGFPYTVYLKRKGYNQEFLRGFKDAVNADKYAKQLWEQLAPDTNSVDLDQFDHAFDAREKSK